MAFWISLQHILCIRANSNYTYIIDHVSSEFSHAAYTRDPGKYVT